MSNIAEPGLLGLAWIVTAPEPPNEHLQTAFAIDARYVYRRETDQSEAVPRPKYYRAEHREVLATDDAWDSARFWEQCDETCEPNAATRLAPIAWLLKVQPLDGIDFNVAELSLKGVGSVRVSSNQVADRLGAPRHKVNQLIERNTKKLSDYGVVSTVLETSGAKGGRPEPSAAT